jgi:hypothetical protein
VRCVAPTAQPIDAERVNDLATGEVQLLASSRRETALVAALDAQQVAYIRRGQRTETGEERHPAGAELGVQPHGHGVGQPFLDG